MRPRPNPMKIAVMLILFAITLVPLSGAAVGAQERTSGAQAVRGAAAVQPPQMDAQAWTLTDQESGLYLTGENPDEQLPIGSMTKIMSALVVLEEGVDLDQQVTISKQAESYVGNTYSNVGLISGERVSVQDLLKASLIPSGTDAVYALAEQVGGGSVENFVRMMNDRAAAMGLKNTNFETPAGLDTSGNYSSARDMATLARAALQYPVFAEIVGTKDATIKTQNRDIEIHNTNQLLTSYPPTTGVKTGTTPQAGANLVASAEANGKSFISVVIGAEDPDARFRDSQALLEYAFGHYERRSLVSQDEVYDELPLPYRRGETVELTATRDVNASVDPNANIERRVSAPDPPSEAEAGQELGEVEVFVDGESAGSSPLVAREGYEAASLLDMAWYEIGKAWDWIWSPVTGLIE